MNRSFITIVTIFLFGYISQTQAAMPLCRSDKVYKASFNILAEVTGLPVSDKFECFHLILVGDIVPGDFDTLKQVLHEYEPYVDTIELTSEGGDVAESLRIGSLIRARLLRTIAPFRPVKPECIENCNCASACFFIWAAGVDRNGDAIVVHRPYDPTGSFGRKQAVVASSEYTALLGIVRNYLLQMDVPTGIIEYMNAVSSSDASYIPQDQVKTYLSGYVPAIHEWLIAGCGSTTTQEDNDWAHLTDKKFELKYLQSSEESYLNLLEEKRLTIVRCEYRKLSRERMRLVKDSPL